MPFISTKSDILFFHPILDEFRDNIDLGSFTPLFARTKESKTL